MRFQNLQVDYRKCCSESFDNIFKAGNVALRRLQILRLIIGKVVLYYLQIFISSIGKVVLRYFKILKSNTGNVILCHFKIYDSRKNTAIKLVEYHKDALFTENKIIKFLYTSKYPQRCSRLGAKKKKKLEI